jgi:hypothetical protein
METTMLQVASVYTELCDQIDTLLGSYLRQSLWHLHITANKLVTSICSYCGSDSSRQEVEVWQ